MKLPAPLKFPELKVPPVITFPVNVSPAGSENVGLPATPSPLVTVISAVVPTNVLFVKTSEDVSTTIPGVASRSCKPTKVLSNAAESGIPKLALVVAAPVPEK